MGAIDYKEAITPPAQDPGNRFIVNKINSKTFAMKMYTNDANANWIAQRLQQKAGYAFADISFPANRNIFRLEVGDLFKLNYSPDGIVDMVVRIVRIEEEPLPSENITVHILEDVDYLSESITLVTAESKAVYPVKTMEVLASLKVVNAPYFVIGDKVGIIPLAARENQLEIGFYLYMSTDGESYTNIATLPSIYCPYGTLVSAYGADTHQVDDGPGFQVDFTNSDVDMIDVITRSQLCGFKNTALLGDEIITFQTITPVSGYTRRYLFTGIYRGRLDTKLENHISGEDFFFTSNTNLQAVEDAEIVAGVTRYFKLVPYSNRHVGDLSAATAFSLDITGRGKIPYFPINLAANGEYAEENPTYETDIVLTWDPRLRGDGAGINSDVFDINFAPVEAPASGYEGYFRIKIYVGGALVRTVTDLAVFTWTYTSVMNIADNGALASSVTFLLTNFREDAGYEYESDDVEITVTLS